MREIILAATALGHFIESEYAELQKNELIPWEPTSLQPLSIGPRGKNWKSKRSGENR